MCYCSFSGVREEKGHFGLWRLCSTKSGDPTETCVHPEDSSYQLPTHANAAGAVSILHLILIASFVVLAVIRVLQVSKNAPDLYLGTKRLCIVKVAVALICGKYFTIIMLFIRLISCNIFYGLSLRSENIILQGPILQNISIMIHTSQ